MKPIFTKRFFDLSDSDQAAVVSSIIHDLKSCIGRHVKLEDDEKTEQRIKRIWTKAVQHGVFQDDMLKTACCAEHAMKGGDQ
jgi:hypothetical protein